MYLKYLFSKIIKKLHIPAIKNSYLAKNAKVCSGSHVVNSNIGRYSYVGNNCTVINSQIGNFCSIADNCIIGGAQHTISWVSTSPVFHGGKNILRKNFSNKKISLELKTIIGSDVWIGNNCLIKSGISIGNGAIIGMGSVVTKDVPDYAIFAGNPAKLIRYRFSDQEVSLLLKSEWWNFDDRLLNRIADFFSDTNKFIEIMQVEVNGK